MEEKNVMKKTRAELILQIDALRKSNRALQMLTAEKRKDAVVEPVRAALQKRPGEYAAAAVWKVFREQGLSYADLLDLAACVVVNVADKSESADAKITAQVATLVANLRKREGQTA